MRSVLQSYDLRDLSLLKGLKPQARSSKDQSARAEDSMNPSALP